MIKGALGVLGTAAVLAIGCAQAFAIDPLPVPTVPVPTVSVPTVPLPVPVPTVEVPVVTDPVPTVPDAPVSAPSAPSLDGGSSGSSGSSGTGGSTSGQVSSSEGGSGGGSGGSSSSLDSSGQQSATGTGGNASTAKSNRSGTVRRFESRPPKFRSRGKGRGTTLVVWLSTDSLVRFSIVRIAPNCRGVGGFLREGSQGRNLFRFSGRIDGKPLSAGTYRIRAAAVQGQRTTSIRRETVVVVPPGESVRSASAQRSTCGRGEEAIENRAAIAELPAIESGQPPSAGGSLVDAGSLWMQSEAGGGQTDGENGAVVAPESSVRPADFLVQPKAPNLAIASDADAGWSPLAYTTAGAMLIALLVIGGRELAERYRD